MYLILRLVFTFNTEVFYMGYELILLTYIARTTAGYKLSSNFISTEAF